MCDYEEEMRYRRWYMTFSADTSGVVLRVVVGWEIGSLDGGDCIASASVYDSKFNDRVFCILLILGFFSFSPLVHF